jgi:glutaredoxin
MRLWPFARTKPPPRVVVYTRAGCHLCDEAWDYLAAERDRRGFELTAVDVDADPALRQEFGECVPVVAVDGKVRFRGRVNPVLFRRLVRGH